MNTIQFKELSKVLKQASKKFENVNRGGCGATAFILASQLSKVVEEIKIVVYGDDNETDIDKVRQNVKENTIHSWNEVGIHIRHVWVEFLYDKEWYAADIEGVKDTSSMYNRWGEPYPGSFFIEEMEELASSGVGWNDWFDRSQAPKMKRFFNKHLSCL